MTEIALQQALQELANDISKRSLVDLFANEKKRLAKFSVSCANLHLDLSRQLLDTSALDVLLQWANERDVTGKLADMAAGIAVNTSENRAAQHMALRAPKGSHTEALGQFVAEEVDQANAAMCQFAREIHAKNRLGVTGKSIRHIVHIGIGGSDLGPRLVYQALAPCARQAFDLRFAANVDAAEINDALKGIDPARTLIVVVSKSFSTTETLANARSARKWLVKNLGENAPLTHLIAVTSRPDRAMDFGLSAENIFGFADWVGGRFSVWSTVGLSLVIALGPEVWEAFLAGAREMDVHALEAPLAQNAPVLSALVSFWNLNFLKLPARAIIPYASRLGLLSMWMQQLVMESNGKSVKADGSPAIFSAAPFVFGDAGTNAQHAFFQALHQGPQIAPIDFIGIRKDEEGNPAQHRTLLANMLAQARALMLGKSLKQVVADHGELSDAELKSLAPQKVFRGNRPSSTILLADLSPRSLGNLLAFYEHETVVLAQLAGVNPFDQWGVELGKVLATQIENRISGKDDRKLDIATEAIMTKLFQLEDATGRGLGK